MRRLFAAADPAAEPAAAAAEPLAFAAAEPAAALAEPLAVAAVGLAVAAARPRHQRVAAAAEPAALTAAALAGAEPTAALAAAEPAALAAAALAGAKSAAASIVSRNLLPEDRSARLACQGRPRRRARWRSARVCGRHLHVPNTSSGAAWYKGNLTIYFSQHTHTHTHKHKHIESAAQRITIVKPTHAPVRRQRLTEGPGKSGRREAGHICRTSASSGFC